MQHYEGPGPSGPALAALNWYFGFLALRNTNKLYDGRLEPKPGPVHEGHSGALRVDWVAGSGGHDTSQTPSGEE
jgi:hypothetical protein